MPSTIAAARRGSTCELAQTQLARHLASGATFTPNDAADRVAFLVREVLAVREATLVGLGVALSAKAEQVPTVESFWDQLNHFRNEAPESRRALLAFPAFLIWLRDSVRCAVRYLAEPGADSLGRLDTALNLFPALRQRARRAAQDPRVRRVCGSIQVCRYDVDPLVARVAPPTYIFPRHSTARAPEAPTAYSLPLFMEFVTVAFDRVANTWPAAHRLMPSFMRTIVHVPDGNFRSASASRYTGVVFLSAGDESLLDIEESLIHEFGHQILYCVLELDQLLRVDATKTFRLPWSGAERDFYGYFHAFYIYILLARYYERLSGRPPYEEERAQRRLLQIVSGLARAVSDFRHDHYYTPAGQQLAATLCGEAEALSRAHLASRTG
jgi:hypothetical protein